jgi:hypothetical protein
MLTGFLDTADASVKPKELSYAVGEWLSVVAFRPKWWMVRNASGDAGGAIPSGTSPPLADRPRVIHQLFAPRTLPGPRLGLETLSNTCRRP